MPGTRQRSRKAKGAKIFHIYIYIYNMLQQCNVTMSHDHAPERVEQVGPPRSLDSNREADPVGLCSGATIQVQQWNARAHPQSFHGEGWKKRSRGCLERKRRRRGLLESAPWGHASAYRSTALPGTSGAEPGPGRERSHREATGLLTARLLGLRGTTRLATAASEGGHLEGCSRRSCLRGRYENRPGGRIPPPRACRPLPRRCRGHRPARGRAHRYG